MKRFIYEIDILRDMDHPGIVQIFEYFQDFDRLYIVTEFIPGKELFQEMNRKKNTKDLFFNEIEASTIIKQVLTIVNYLHQKNIIHRDLKLENVMIQSMPTKDEPDAPWYIKLIDFGTAMRFKKGQRFKQAFGTSYYIAPEVLNGNYNEKCDIWCVGVILYFLLSGRPPFIGEDDLEIIDKIKNSEI